MFNKIRGLFSADLSIDLGTANTLIYMREQGIVLTSHRGVSQKLNIQPKTVHAHKRNLFSKMNFNSHRELVSFAILNGLLELDDLIST